MEGNQGDVEDDENVEGGLNVISGRVVALEDVFIKIGSPAKDSWLSV